MKVPARTNLIKGTERVAMGTEAPRHRAAHGTEEAGRVGAFRTFWDIRHVLECVGFQIPDGTISQWNTNSAVEENNG
ncbi:unnamed protein product [Nezara viridula]|uniref:Uncharacterized protein n=1 Tax=Nezara viridula TaxID=85310 RepID=A0A9P0E2Z1_NEZVI|nr:unnamed protein product [Nezara viridula]